MSDTNVFNDSQRDLRARRAAVDSHKNGDTVYELRKGRKTYLHHHQYT